MDNLLAIVNSPGGRSLLSFLGEKPQGQILAISPHSYIEYIGRGDFRLVAFSGNAITRLFSAYETPFFPKPLRYLVSPATYNPAAGSVSPVDGMVRRVSVDEAFSSIQSGNGVQALAAETNIEACLLTATITSNQYGTLSRGFFLFNTATLTNNVAITAATFSLYVTAKSDTLGSASSVALVAATTAANDGLVVTDFEGTVGNTTLLATAAAISGIATSAYLDLTLNAAGLAAISKTGLTKLGMRMESDRANSAPTWASSGSAKIDVNYADNVTNIPKLVVTFNVMGGGGILPFL